MTQDELKTLVGQAALQYVPEGSIVGVGTGSTVDKFIDALGEALKANPKRVTGAVSSSVRSTRCGPDPRKNRGRTGRALRVHRR